MCIDACGAQSQAPPYEPQARSRCSPRPPVRRRECILLDLTACHLDAAGMARWPRTTLSSVDPYAPLAIRP